MSAFVVRLLTLHISNNTRWSVVLRLNFNSGGVMVIMRNRLSDFLLAPGQNIAAWNRQPLLNQTIRLDNNLNRRIIAQYIHAANDADSIAKFTGNTLYYTYNLNAAYCRTVILFFLVAGYLLYHSSLYIVRLQTICSHIAQQRNIRCFKRVKSIENYARCGIVSIVQCYEDQTDYYVFH